MQETFARARTRPLGQARATIGYLVYNIIPYSQGQTKKLINKADF